MSVEDVERVRGQVMRPECGRKWKLTNISKVFPD